MLQNRDMSEDNGAAVRASHVQHRARPPRPPSLVSKSLKMMLLDGHHLQAKGSCSGNAVLSHSTRGDAPHSVKGIQDRLPADSGSSQGAIKIASEQATSLGPSVHMQHSTMPRPHRHAPVPPPSCRMRSLLWKIPPPPPPLFEYSCLIKIRVTLGGCGYLIAKARVTCIQIRCLPRFELTARQQRFLNLHRG